MGRQGVLAVLALVSACEAKHPAGDVSALTMIARPFGAVAQLAFGSTVSDVVNAAPILTVHRDGNAAIATGHDGAAYVVVTFADDLVTGVTIERPDLSIEDVGSVWGSIAPVEVPGRGTHYFYVSGNHEVRADVSALHEHGVSFVFQPTQPLVSLLGTTPSVSLVGVDVLGVPGAAVATALRAAHLAVTTVGNVNTVSAVPGTDWGQLMLVTYRVGDDGNVASVAMSFTFDRPDGEAIVLHRFEQKWGKPIAAADGTLTYLGASPIVVKVTPASLALTAGTPPA